MTTLAIGGLIILGLGLIFGVRYLASDRHERASNPGEAGDHFSRNDPGIGDPGSGH